MYTKYIGGGKMQHKAYCSKHSLEQRTKVKSMLLSKTFLSWFAILFCCDQSLII